MGSERGKGRGERKEREREREREREKEREKERNVLVELNNKGLLKQVAQTCQNMPHCHQ